jgi:hypothetical protein
METTKKAEELFLALQRNALDFEEKEKKQQEGEEF